MLRGLFASVEERSSASAVWGDWPGDGGGASWSGMRVDRGTALQLLAVYGSARLITDTISTMPVDVFRRAGDTQEEVSVPSWLGNPTQYLTFKQWCTQILLSLLLSGNAYIRVERDLLGTIKQLIPLDPSQVQVVREEGRKVFRVQGRRYTTFEVLHLTALMLPGSDVGLSPVENARQTIGLGLSALQYGGQFFDGDGNMPGVIESDKIMQPETKKSMASQWRRMRSRTGKGLPGILDDAAKWKATGVTNEQAQFLATRQFTAGEIAGQMFGVDPTELGIPVEGSALTYQNLAQRGTRLVGTTCRPWMERVEDGVTSLLPRPQFMKFNAGAWLRGDIKTQFETWKIGIDGQWMVPNEARAFMDWEPLPGGDVVVKKAAPAAPTTEVVEDAA